MPVREDRFVEDEKGCADRRAELQGALFLLREGLSVSAAPMPTAAVTGAPFPRAAGARMASSSSGTTPPTSSLSRSKSDRGSLHEVCKRCWQGDRHFLAVSANHTSRPPSQADDNTPPIGNARIHRMWNRAPVTVREPGAGAMPVERFRTPQAAPVNRAPWRPRH